MRHEISAATFLLTIVLSGTAQANTGGVPIGWYKWNHVLVQHGNDTCSDRPNGGMLAANGNGQFNNFCVEHSDCDWLFFHGECLVPGGMCKTNGQAWFGVRDSWHNTLLWGPDGVDALAEAFNNRHPMDFQCEGENPTLRGWFLKMSGGSISADLPSLSGGIGIVDDMMNSSEFAMIQLLDRAPAPSSTVEAWARLTGFIASILWDDEIPALQFTESQWYALFWPVCHQFVIVSGANAVVRGFPSNTIFDGGAESDRLHAVRDELIGDPYWVYLDTLTPVRSSTWGGIKAIYR